MKRTGLLALAVMLCGVALPAEEHTAGTRTNPLFEKLKPLVGTWEGVFDGKKGRTVYSLTSGGSALVEDLLPDSKENMLDVIHPDGSDALMFTHYCGAANQPRYRATTFDGNRIAFKFVDGTNIGTDYMSGVTLTLVDADHLVQEWENTSKGKVTTFKFEFTRVK